MLISLCSKHEVPDVCFFVNQRDFPLLKRDGSGNYIEPYDALIGAAKDVKNGIIQNMPELLCPVFSYSPTDEFVDIPLPTADDWSIVSGKSFPTQCSNIGEAVTRFNLDFDTKIPKAIFRGSATGRGIDTETNVRLRAAMISKNSDILDAGITKPFVRQQVFRRSSSKNNSNVELTARGSDLRKLDLPLVKNMDAVSQSNYKYILHLMGHVEAYRLSRELASNSVVLIADTPHTLWFKPLLKPMEHYVPVNSDLSNLEEQIQWCIDNDGESCAISRRGREFYESNINEESIFHYLLDCFKIMK